jgi:Homeodomain-like domain
MSHIAALTRRSRSLVERTRKRFVLSGLEAALWHRRPGSPPKLDARGRPTLIALACANPPEGRTCSTMQLLANELVARHVVGAISDETVRQKLKKNGLKPRLREHWCIPEVSPAFVAAMEDVLDLYAEPYDPERPVIGFDECGSMSVAVTWPVSPTWSASPAAIDRPPAPISRQRQPGARPVAAKTRVVRGSNRAARLPKRCSAFRSAALSNR